MSTFAMVFPGQGSQAVGMLKEVAEDHIIVRKTFAEASSILGYDLWLRVQQGPAEELNKTRQAQPALLASSVALWRIWQKMGGEKPVLLAGHSLGEYSALVCAGSLDFSEAIALVALRGKLMQEAVPEGKGAMSAVVGLDCDSITIACKKAAQGKIVSLANFNSPDQIVISGHKEAVERAIAFCKRAGAKRVLSIPVSVPSHCILMKPASERLAKALKSTKFFDPQIPVINSVDVCIETNPESIRRALIRQLYSPVRWKETVQYLADQGVKILLEMGPGKVLSGLNKHTVSTLITRSINNRASLAAAIKP